MQKAIYQVDEARSAAAVKTLSLGAMIGRGLWLALIVTLAPVCLMIDVQVLANGVSEYSAVEFAQLILLALSALSFTYLAKRKREDRSFALLAAAFFACMLIREMDAYFDVIAHGFWKYLVAPLALAAVVQALRQGRATLAALSRFSRSQAGLLVMAGLVVVLFYSRLMGMTGLWQGVMGDGYVRVVKNAIEESAELLGYSIMFAGAARYLLHRLRKRRQATLSS